MEKGKRKRSSSTDEPKDINKTILLNEAESSTHQSIPEDLKVVKNDAKSETSVSLPLSRDVIELAIEQIEALQEELKAHKFEDETDSEDETNSEDEEITEADFEEQMEMLRKFDPKTLGFLACAQETIKYLTDHGVPRDNPMLLDLRDRLIEGIHKI